MLIDLLRNELKKIICFNDIKNLKLQKIKANHEIEEVKDYLDNKEDKDFDRNIMDDSELRIEIEFNKPICSVIKFFFKL